MSAPSLVLALTLSILVVSASTVLASTDPKAVDQIERQREGNLPQMVVDYYTKNVAVACDIGNAVKYEVVLVASSSMHQDKVADPIYDFQGTYFVAQKCQSGSTYAGAYSELKSAALIDGSFSSKYNKKRGPAKMQNLKIVLLKKLDLGPPPM